MDKIILIDKPAGLTSFGVVSRIRRVLTAEARAEALKNGQTPPKRLKVGHTGTLDPFATGLLIIMAGKATKRCAEFLKKDKEYIATLTLGATSTTGDPEGEITKHQIQTPPTKDQIQQALTAFTGEILQQPPAFSAIKIDGRRAYDLARRGETVNLPSRPVTIHSLDVLDYHFPTLTLRAHVSSGTYIRALAADLGAHLGCGAYLTALRRTKIASYDVADAISLDAFLNESKQ